tara:strand:- start:147 stop:350 length:204 start_codon:yes stop_codon:yes gene_type:complete
MGCGCKNKKKRKATVENGENVYLSNSEIEANERRKTIMEQKNYQDKVKDALKQLTEIRRRKRSLKNK